MQDFPGPLRHSAADLLRFTACPHATTLDLPRLRAQARAAPRPGWREALTGNGIFGHRPDGPATPEDVLHLVLLSDLLTPPPAEAQLQGNSGPPETLRLADYAHYTRDTLARFEAFLDQPPATRPEPCSACPGCPHLARCTATWQTEDSLFLLPGLPRAQVKKLEAAGVTRRADLTRRETPVPGLPDLVLARLRQTARLQQAGTASWELRDALPARGFALLPRPDAGDLFCTATPEGSFTLRGTAGLLAAPDLPALMQHLRESCSAAPEARIYHYGSLALTTLRQQVTQAGQGEAALDRLLRERRFVDLAAVLRGGLLTSATDLSLMGLAEFYAPQDAPEEETAALRALRDWLVQIRPDHPWPLPAPEAAAQEDADDTEITALRAQLAASTLSPARQELLFNLGLFHTREAKPAQWAVFDSATREDDQLLEDLDALGGLVALGAAEPVKRSVVRSYRYPAQDTKLRAGRKVTVPNPDGPPVTVTIEAMEPQARRISLKTGAAKSHLLTDRLSLHPDWPLNTSVLADALRDVIADQIGEGRYRALTDLLDRAAPRLRTGQSPDLLRGAEPVAGTQNVTAAMEETVLPIQGPPGTGKTYVSARAILALVRSGARVGIASGSHEAVRNLLMGCLAALEDRDTPLDMLHKVSGSEDGYPEDCPIRRTTDNAEAAASGQIVGGTAFFFARPENIQQFDWLFVDEAGQVSLANMLAMGRAARNLVLVGDPRQLPQVIQGSHPAPADLSCLDWILGDHITVPPDRGILLPLSRRMHPQICDFISRQIYDDRLQSHPDAARQQVRAPGLPQAGVFWQAVTHDGNAQTAPEEVAAILATTTALLAGSWQDKDGLTRALTPGDIIVVAPYNAQVNALRAALSQGVRVGTVDKFQGQEAPVCLVSMTASSVGETSRGMAFLLSQNRINVAISRAKALALVFGSPRLRAAPCESVGEMRLVNTLCALPELTP